MIPKIIHFCWLSGEPYPDLVEKCILTWKQKLTDYEFVLWDTKRFDVNQIRYVKEAYEMKKYAFASDYIRLYALYHYGGIYLDSDIEVYKSFDPLLDSKAFTGFENDSHIAAWIFGSEKGNPLFKELLGYYDGKSFYYPDGTPNMTPNVMPVTKTLIKHGLVLNGKEQKLDNITVYPRDFFCPYNPFIQEQNRFTENTYCKHWFDGKWVDKEQKKLIEKKHLIESKYGSAAGKVYYSLGVLRKDGIYSFINQLKTMIAISNRVNKKK